MKTNFIKESPLFLLRLREHPKIADAARSFVLSLSEGLMSLYSLVVTESIVGEHGRGCAILDMMANLFRAGCRADTLTVCHDIQAAA